jgi:hypothetical protein
MFSGEVKDVPIILFVPLLTPCTENEKLCITVDLMKGTFLVSLAHQGLFVAYIIANINFPARYVTVFYVITIDLILRVGLSNVLNASCKYIRELLMFIVIRPMYSLCVFASLMTIFAV